MTEFLDNVAMAKYGLTIRQYENGDGDIVWGRMFRPHAPGTFVVDSLALPADPELTDLGEREAADAHSKWVLEKEGSIPIPGKFYCSPLTRALRTSEITFDGLAITNTIVLEVYLQNTTTRPALADQVVEPS
jgi:hypothetical protein